MSTLLNLNVGITFLSTLLLFSFGQPVAHGQSGKVEVVRKGDSWQLIRNGQPFIVKGAGGEGALDLLTSCGGNSGRTWDVGDDTPARLDEAQKNAVGMTVGLWLGHERHGMDYSDLDAVSTQIDRTMGLVRQVKDHPALMIWGLGNEMEGNGDNAAIYAHIESLAQMIKQEDPNHPVMTVIAEMGGKKIEAIHKLCPSVDIIGINSYGGAASLPERYRKLGGTKPYIVTEFGPVGTWESPKNSFGAVNEPTSAVKAASYRAAAEAFAKDKELCLGSYAFLWGNKQEGTATWFGMLLPNGNRTAAVDVMTELWSGKKPANRCPQIDEIKLLSGNMLTEGGVVEVSLSVSDPESDPINVKWVVTGEADSYNTGGDEQAAPGSIQDAILSGDQRGAKIKLSGKPGIYRIYAYADDGSHGGSATANVSVVVKGKAVELEQPGAGVKLPLVILDEPGGQQTAGGKMLYAASGFMGSVEALSVKEDCAEDPKFGAHCTRVVYDSGSDWGGVVWQNPVNDWGALPGGFDLTGAKKLTFWAKGAKGGEVVKFGLGVIGKDQPFFDTSKQEEEFKLTSQWKQHSIDLAGQNLKRIKTGFFFSLAGQGENVTFYLDRIQYE